MGQHSQCFRLHRPAQDDPSAVVFDSPHSGESLPRQFRYACARNDLMFLHDPYVNQLLSGVTGTGSPLLEALIHRSYIDLNRHEYEVDPARLDGDWTLPIKETFYTSRNAGVFPVFAGPRTNRLTPIYNEAARLTAQDAEKRILHYHRPYYAALQELLQESHDRHGQVLHLNMHSSHRNPSQPQADFVLGDLNGKACAPDLRDYIENFLKKRGYSVDFNGTFFSGGAIIQRTHNTQGGFHSLQIEIARDLYMDQDRLALLPERAAKIKDNLFGAGPATLYGQPRQPVCGIIAKNLIPGGNQRRIQRRHAHLHTQLMQRSHPIFRDPARDDPGKMR